MPRPSILTQVNAGLPRLSRWQGPWALHVHAFSWLHSFVHEDPNEERDACEDETSFGLTEIQWAAVAVGLSVMGGCLAWLKWGFKSPCKKLGVNLDEPEWCCSPSQKKLDQSVAEPSLRSSAEPGEDPEAGPGPADPPESDPGATRQ